MAVEFNEENSFRRPEDRSNESPKIAGWLIKKGMAKDMASANRIQIIVIIIFFILAIFIGTW